MIECFAKKCTGCRACEKLCPKSAITMIENKKGFLYPQVDYKKCIKCGLCKTKCPINNIEEKNDIKAYAAFNRDEEIRKKSSSGGLFTLFAEYIIENGGAVFGASFDKDFKVEHIKVERKEELDKLRGSKYVQSDTKNTYKEAKELLENGRLVYYSGTPCQVEGLYSYIGKEYDNLITQDIICHGVPSPKIWESYLKYKNRSIEKVNFRSKENSTWENYEISFKYNDGEESINHDQDIYMKLFLKDAILRESCYNCSFKKKNRESDITLADFWGIDKVVHNFNDQKGVSLLILNSKKGQRLKDMILEKLVLEEIELDNAIKYNKSMIRSVKKHKKSQDIFEKLNNGNIFEVFEKQDFLAKVDSYIKTLFGLLNSKNKIFDDKINENILKADYCELNEILNTGKKENSEFLDNAFENK